MSKRQNKETNSLTIYITAAILVAVMFILFPACSGQKKKTAPAIIEGDSLPTMRSTGVETLVSDSGMICYKVITEEWLIYSKRNPPFWAFEKGVYL